MAEIQAGRTYKVVNVRSGTVMDLSGTDGYTSTCICPVDIDVSHFVDHSQRME